MFFNSLTFLAFLPLFLVCFFIARGKGRLATALAGSYLFYGWWDYRFLSLIVLSTLIDFFVGRAIDQAKEAGLRKRLLIASLVSNLGMLFVFKYFNFFRDSLIEACRTIGYEVSNPTIDIILPVGISFYTFQTLSYTIDIYRRRLKPEPSILNFAVFVSFFPQLVAGPIVRASDFLPQLRRDRPLRYDNVVIGVTQMMAGFVKKCVIADSLAPFVEVVFANPESRTTATVVVAVIFYAFQIYGDFAGYSDIAIGLARVMGYHFPENFRRPYFANSFSDFWQRWHISLSSWLRDYLYIPLGGNRRGKMRMYINLMLTMLMGGLWHGAAWKFVVWGALHGGYLVGQRLISELVVVARLTKSSGTTSSWTVLLLRGGVRLLSGGIVFVLVCLAWIFFRAEDFGSAMAIIRRIGDLDGVGIGAIQNKVIAAKGLALIGALLLCDSWSGCIRVRARSVASPLFLATYVCVMGWLIAWLGTFGSSPFIYFQF